MESKYYLLIPNAVYTPYLFFVLISYKVKCGRQLSKLNLFIGWVESFLAKFHTFEFLTIFLIKTSK